MFCKYCGETIDRRTMKCSACGKSAGPLAGGVGFWDLAAQPASAVQPAPNVQPAPAVQPVVDNPRKKQPAPQKVSILSVLALILSLVLLVMNIIMLGNIRTLEQKYEALEQKYEDVSTERSWFEQMVQDAIEKATDETEPQGTDPTETEPPKESEKTEPLTPTTDPQHEETPEWITKPPRNEEVKKGENGPITLFVMDVARVNLEFHWEKYDEETDTWSAVGNDRYEEKDEPKGDGTRAILYLKEWSKDACGKYRCRIVDENGDEFLSNEVFVTIEE